MTSKVQNPLSWRADDFVEAADYRLSLAPWKSDFDRLRDEIHRRGWRLETLDPQLLPLDGICAAASDLVDILAHRRGFCILSDLVEPGAPFGDAAMLFWLLGSAMGRPMPQNKAGDRLGVVEDRSDREPQDRGYRTNGELTFHTDVADIVGLMCERTAKSGGESRIASALAVHDIMLAERPDLLEPLYRGYHYDRPSEGVGAGSVTPHHVPVFSVTDGALSARLYRPLAELGTRRAGLEFTNRDRDALDLLEDIAGRPDVGLRFRLEPGEILLLNNYTVLHARTAFADFADAERKRRLLRLWIRSPGFRPVNPAMELDFVPPPLNSRKQFFMTPPDTAILHDQQRIRDVILRYFAGLDRKDPALFDEVFQPDAVMTALAGGRTFHGREEIARSLMTVRDYEHTAHFPTSQLIEVSGDAARADTFGIAYIVLGGTEQKVIVRGLQYLDDLVRTEAGWRIAHRQHIPLWQSDLDRAPLLLPSQPVKG